MDKQAVVVLGGRDRKKRERKRGTWAGRGVLGELIGWSPCRLVPEQAVKDAVGIEIDWYRLMTTALVPQEWRREGLARNDG